jgi:hypothetical protein
VSIKLILEKGGQVAKKILQALVAECDKLFNKSKPKVETIARSIIRNAVYNSPTMDSLRNGILKYDFGLTFDPSGAIADAVANSIDVKVQKTRLSGQKLSGGITLNVQPSNLLNLLSLPEATQITEKGVSLPWLEWLTMYGNQIIIVDFGVEYGAGLGRTGNAHMVSTNRPFQVNSSFAGTIDDNFIVRAINSIRPQLEKEIERILS